jgi:hypothetical protein
MTYDGVRIYQKESPGGGLSQICFDEVGELSGDSMYYSCTWESTGWSDGTYELIAVPVVEGSEDLSLSDTILVQIDNSCPTVIGTVPIEGSVYVDEISVEFSELMASSSLGCDDLSFRVYDVTTESFVLCQVIVHTDRIYEFVPDPSTPIIDDHEYQGIVYATATDSAGNPLCSEFRWSFNQPPCPFEVFATTNQSGAFIAQIAVEGIAADVNDCVGAFDSHGTCVGVSDPVFDNGYSYINLVVYGDDPTTPEVDEGMNDGECFTLKFFDASENQVLQYPSQFCCWVNMNGAPLPGECGGNPILLVNFEATSCIDIPLCEGWSLISFASVPEEKSIDSIFKDCMSDLIYVTSFDGGSVFYDPNGPDFLNTLVSTCAY